MARTTARGQQWVKVKTHRIQFGIQSDGKFIQMMNAAIRTSLTSKELHRSLEDSCDCVSDRKVMRETGSEKVKRSRAGRKYKQIFCKNSILRAQKKITKEWQVDLVLAVLRFWFIFSPVSPLVCRIRIWTSGKHQIGAWRVGRNHLVLKAAETLINKIVFTYLY